MSHTVTLTKPIVVNGSVVAAGATASFDYGTAAGMVQRGVATWTDPRPDFEDFTLTKDEIEALCRLRDEVQEFPVGAAAPAIAIGLGKTAAEGLKLKIIEETVSFAGNAALYKALTTPIPAGAVLLSVQANIESALTGGSTTVKVGLGPNASDPDKYGKTSALTKNAKITTIPDWAVLGSQEAIDICACATNGAAGDTALTVGSVRVRIVYLQAADLANAA